jgi:hypothetical protein
MSRGFTTMLFGVLAAAASGCVAAEGDESFVIVNNLIPEVDLETGTVAFTANREGPFFSRGEARFDSLEFFVGSLFESRVQAAEGRESLRTIQIEGANISLEISPIKAVDLTTNAVDEISAGETIQFKTNFSSSLTPNGGLSVGIYSIVPFEVMANLRARAGAAVGDPNKLVVVEVVSTTTAFGDFYGDRIDATPFVFPVLITN